MKLSTLLFVPVFFSACFAHSQQLDPAFDEFSEIYQQELGSTKSCHWPEKAIFRVCSDALKNEGNGPYILHHGHVTDKVVVLFHGLSDSPFFFKSIAEALYQQGNNVVVALLPGHGKKEADADMRDPRLAKRWSRHVAEVMGFSQRLGQQKYIGGFSTGGALATQYILRDPGQVKGLMLFSGALALASSVENMAGIWGMKWLANILDEDYAAIGPNPYKYPHIASFSAFQLMDIIFDVRERLEKKQGIDVPIFAAHSLADTTTKYAGIEHLMGQNKGGNSLFKIPADIHVCHADVVISQQQLLDMHYDSAGVSEPGACDIPMANPQHPQMVAATLKFLEGH
ncbi:MAG: pimeloyl-ACP methyl ester carboxylesterase [Paraglaciecola sp.]|jgi:pimeloyl-ACP methyl ester carboxylesterase